MSGCQRRFWARALHAVLAAGLALNLVAILAWPALQGSAAGTELGRAYSLLCHQLPSRCLRVGGCAMPVCARCLGVWAGLALGVTGILAGGGIALAGVAAIGFLIATLLLAIVRPLWYQMLLLRLGIFRSARPNDMVQAGVGRTFQNIRLFKNMTAVENVLIGMHTRMHSTLLDGFLSTPRARREEDASDRRAQEFLTLVGLHGIGNELAKNLPYGDQRRLEIARALASGPKLLLLDEPAAGMNPRETQDLMKLISRLRTDLGLTILLIEHDMRVVMGISDRVTVLDAGRKIAEGTPEEVRRDPRVIEAYLGKPAA